MSTIRETGITLRVLYPERSSLVLADAIRAQGYLHIGELPSGQLFRQVSDLIAVGEFRFVGFDFTGMMMGTLIEPLLEYVKPAYARMQQLNLAISQSSGLSPGRLDRTRDELRGRYDPFDAMPFAGHFYWQLGEEAGPRPEPVALPRVQMNAPKPVTLPPSRRTELWYASRSAYQTFLSNGSTLAQRRNGKHRY